jgi:hypothetical protein
MMISILVAVLWTVVAVLVAVALDGLIHIFVRRTVDDTVRAGAAMDALDVQEQVLRQVLQRPNVPVKLKCFLFDIAQLIDSRPFAHHLADWVASGCPPVNGTRRDAEDADEIEEMVAKLKRTDVDTYELVTGTLRQILVATLLQWPESAKHLFRISHRVVAEDSHEATRCAVIAKRIVHRQEPFTGPAAAAAA